MSTSGVAVCLLVVCVVACSAADAWKPVPYQQKTAEDVSARALDAAGRWWLPVAQLRGLRSLYDECVAKDEDYGVACLKGKALVLLDRAMSKESIAIGEGVTLVRSKEATEKMITSEDQLNADLPRELGQREARLDDMLVDHVATFLQTHTVKLDLSGRAFQNNINEARKKGKKALPYILFAMITTGKLILAYSLKTIALIAGKALIVAKIALVLASVIGLKKLFHHEPEHSSHEVSSRVTYAHEPHHHYGRSFGSQEKRSEEAQKLAYNMQIPRPQ